MRLPLPGKLSYTSLAALLSCSGLVHAETPAAVQAAVERAARTHLAGIAATAGLLKPSVQLQLLPRDAVKPCTRNARIDPIDTRSAARMRFSAVCEDAQPWSVEFVVRATVVADVVVAATDIRAGSIIDASALAVERREIAVVEDALSDPALIAGKSSRRALRRGQAVSRRALIEPILVKRGAAVNIVARNAGVEVHVAGEALEAGRRDEVVRVRNKTNGNTIRARVVGENSVEPADSGISPDSR